MLYLYALLPTDAVTPKAPGVDGATTQLVPLGAVAAAVAEIAGAVEPSREQVLAHARVLDSLAAVNDAVLPVRFGRGFRDRVDLETSLAPLAPAFRVRLADVRGCVEIGLHVVAAPQDSAPPARSGSEYMRHRLGEEARARTVAETIHAPLAELSRSTARSRVLRSTALLRAAYLVPRDGVDRFRAAVDDARRRNPDLTFACTGPWPPYSFAALDAEAAV